MFCLSADSKIEGEKADFRALNVREGPDVFLNVRDQGGSSLLMLLVRRADGSEVIHSQPAAAHIEQGGWLAVDNFGSSFGPLAAPQHRCLAVN